MAKENISLRIENDIREKIETEAKAQNRTFSNMLITIIKEWFATKDLKNE